jgi:hypothetical protein
MPAPATASPPIDGARPRARGSAWATFAALIALGAAAAALTAPMLRPVVRDLVRETELSPYVMPWLADRPPEQVTVDLGALDQRLARLGDAVTALRASTRLSDEELRQIITRPTDATRLEAFELRLGQIDARLADVAGIIAAAQDAVRVATGRVDAVGTTLSRESSRIDGVIGDVKAVGGRIDAAEAATRALAGKLDATDGAVKAVDGAVKAVGDRLGQTTAKLDDSAKALGQRVDAGDAATKTVDQRVGAVDQRVSAVDGALKVVDQRVGALEGGSKAMEPRVQGAEAGVKALEPRVEATETGVKALGGRLEAAESGVRVLAPRVEAAENDVKAAARQIETGAASLNAVGERVQKVESGMAELRGVATGGAERLLPIAQQLREAIRSSQPFAREVAAARVLVGDDAALAPLLVELARQAPSGVPSFGRLREGFMLLSPRILAAPVAASGSTWGDAASGWLGAVLTSIGMPGLMGDTSTPAVVARVESRLNRGDLSSAVNELELLTGAAANEAAPWLVQARARLVVEKAASDLLNSVIGKLAQPR